MWERQVWNCFWVTAEELLLSNLGWFQKAFQFSEKEVLLVIAYML